MALGFSGHVSIELMQALPADLLPADASQPAIALIRRKRWAERDPTPRLPPSSVRTQL